MLTGSLSNVASSGDTGFYLRIAENTVGRLYEASASMISCFACGTTGSVDSLARVVIEGSWTTRFVLGGDYKNRMFAYLFQYTRKHPRKHEEWREIVESTRPDDKFTLTAISCRKIYIEGMHDFINKIRTEVGQPDIDELLRHWTKSLFGRCESLGEQKSTIRTIID